MALLDSGNLLQDPISKSDVVIIKASLLENFLPKDYDFEKMDISYNIKIYKYFAYE